MDLRTADLLDALDPVGVEMLLALLAEPATEVELLDAIAAASQPTANRRLERLRNAGLLVQEPGKLRAPGRLWTVVHPEETEALLGTLFDLSEAVDKRAKAKRQAAQRQLKLARARRLGISRSDGRSSSGSR